MSNDSRRLWCALVNKNKLTCNPSQIADVKFCWAADFDEAAKVFRNANWPQAYWVKDKSGCAVIKLFEVFDQSFYEGEDIPEDILGAELLRSLPVEQRQELGEIVERPKRRRRRKKSS